MLARTEVMEVKRLEIKFMLYLIISLFLCYKKYNITYIYKTKYKITKINITLLYYMLVG